MIQLKGLIPYEKNKNQIGDIEIKITGLKPGEKVHEQLYYSKRIQKTLHPKIFKVDDIKIDNKAFDLYLNNIIISCRNRNLKKLKSSIFSKCLDIFQSEDINTK